MGQPIHMIVSASRRTDIPAFYPEWMLNRLKEGYVLVPNPRNPHRITKIILNPENVDCIVFWSKNPEKMIGMLKQIGEMGYHYYFTVTLTAYGKEAEKHLPEKEKVIDTFCRLSDMIGPERVDWRFDPIMVSKEYSKEWHLEKFDWLCERLGNYTKRCIVSFLDPYRHLDSDFHDMSETEIRETAAGLSGIASRYQLPLYTCAEQIDLSEFQIQHASCIDQRKIEQITGYPIRAKKDSGQRPACGCIASVDVGMYDTCGHGCRYCYATFYGEDALKRRMAAHNPNSKVLIGEPAGDELITEKAAGSDKITQMKLPF